MAVTVDQANIGTLAKGSGEANNERVDLTTTAAVASGAMIAFLVFRFRSGGTGTMTGSGGGLTWTTVATSTSGDIGIYLLCAFAPSGLASSSTITCTSTVNNNDWTVCAASYAGVDTSGTVTAAVRGTNGNSAGTAAWATPAVTSTSGDGLIGGCGGDGTLRTNTAAGDATERIDFNSATTSGSVTLGDDLAAETNDTLAGTWSGTLTHVTVAAAFIPAGGAAAVPTMADTFNAIPFMK